MTNQNSDDDQQLGWVGPDNPLTDRQQYVIENSRPISKMVPNTFRQPPQSGPFYSDPVPPPDETPTGLITKRADAFAAKLRPPSAPPDTRTEDQKLADFVLTYSPAETLMKAYRKSRLAPALSAGLDDQTDTLNALKTNKVDANDSTPPDADYYKLPNYQQGWSYDSGTVDPRYVDKQGKDKYVHSGGVSNQ